MPKLPAIELHLRVESVEPISGQMRRDVGGWTPFVGWTGLTVALDDALQAAAAETAKLSQQGNGST
jgi:hypothetical protein